MFNGVKGWGKWVDKCGGRGIWVSWQGDVREGEIDGKWFGDVGDRELFGGVGRA